MRKVTMKLHEQVFEEIKNMVKEGTYRKGDFLPSENELVELLGVSRVTVRQALKHLAEAGIIETRKGRGSIVAVDWKMILEEKALRTTVEEYQNTFLMSTKARRVLEPAVARQAAQSATEEDMARMEAVLERGDELYKEKSGQHSRKNRILEEFHGLLWASAHNPVMDSVWEELVRTSAFTDSVPLVAPIYRELESEEARRQHRNIFEAVKRRDGDYAYFHMLVHCDWIYDMYRTYFDEFLQ